ncbi:MAG TPA: hypothetical protein VK084_09835 [Chitinophagaceae bacterium]|nr:hypothetical protein [Chitinophagaceae bacterium]
MMRKKACLLAVMLLFVGQALFAQSLKDVKQDLYYDQSNAALKAMKDMGVPGSRSDIGIYYYYLGVAQTNLDTLEAAHKSFETILEEGKKRDAGLAYVGYGRIEVLKGNYEKAKQYFQKAWDESKGRDMNVLRGIIKATSLDPKADAKFAINLLDEFKNNSRNDKYEFTAEDYTAIGNIYAHQSTGGGKAATSFETALLKDPHYAKAAFKLGNLWERARQDSLALLNWEKAAKADSKFTPVFLKLFTYYRVRDLGKAENYLNKYMKLTDDKLNAKIYLVDVLYLQDKYDEAISKAQDLMKQPIDEKTHTRLYKLIAVSKMKLEDYEAAKKNMDTYFSNVKEEDIKPFDYKTYASIMEKMGNKDKQLEYLSKYVDADTTTNLAFIRKTAEDLSKDDEYKAAKLWYDKLFKIAKDDETTMGDYYYRAKAMYGAAINNIGSYDDAAAAWSTFIEKYPDQPSGYFYKGRTLQMKDTSLSGLGMEAYNQYIAAVKKDSSNDLSNIQSTLKNIYSYGAKCAAKQKNMDQAKVYMGKLLEIDPHSTVVANIYSNLALTNLKAKNLDAATQYAKKALSINENDKVAPQVLDYAQQMQEYKKKKAAYEKAKAERANNQ